MTQWAARVAALILTVLTAVPMWLPAPTVHAQARSEPRPAAPPVAAQKVPAPPGGWVPLAVPLPAPAPGAMPQAPPQAAPPPQAGTPVAKAPPAGAGQVTLQAHLTEDGQRIDQGLVWRVYSGAAGPDGRYRLVATSREGSPSIALAAGEYLVNASFGRAHLTQRITVKGGAAHPERFVLNAGGLRVGTALANGQPVSERLVTYEIYSDERDQFNNRTKVMSGARPGLIIRLNAGIYHIRSLYGDANAVAAADVTVEAGKLTDATVNHAAGKVTFKLVQKEGGEALADTDWAITTAQGDVVIKSAGALPTHVLAPGTYLATASNGGRSYRREFIVEAGDVGQIEVVMK